MTDNVCVTFQGVVAYKKVKIKDNNQFLNLNLVLDKNNADKVIGAIKTIKKTYKQVKNTCKDIDRGFEFYPMVSDDSVKAGGLYIKYENDVFYCKILDENEEVHKLKLEGLQKPESPSFEDITKMRNIILDKVKEKGFQTKGYDFNKSIPTQYIKNKNMSGRIDYIKTINDLYDKEIGAEGIDRGDMIAVKCKAKHTTFEGAHHVSFYPQSITKLQEKVIDVSSFESEESRLAEGELQKMINEAKENANISVDDYEEKTDFEHIDIPDWA